MSRGWKEHNESLRKEKFESGYKHKHPILFEYMYMELEEKQEFLKQYIHPDTYWTQKQLIRHPREWDYIIEEPIWEVYQFPLFTEEFCNMLIEESENFGEFLDPKEAANSNITYPTTDLGLDSIPGKINYIDTPLSNLYNFIQQEYIKPIIFYVWKYRVERFQSSYVLKYSPDGQDFLQPHHDDSACASIVSLNNNYEGGGTWFDRQKTVVEPKTGWCTLHPSKLTHRHAGRRVTKGTRYILITFID